MTIDSALDDLTSAATALADAEQALAQNQIDRVLHEAAVVNSLLGAPNPLTGKPHSVNSATEAAALDDRTIAYRTERLALERTLTLARATYRVAELRALAIANVAGRVEL